MKRFGLLVATVGLLFLGACASVPPAPQSTSPNLDSKPVGTQEVATPPKQEAAIVCVRPAFDGKMVSVVVKDHGETETGKRRPSIMASRTKAEEILVVRGAVSQQLRAWGATVTERREDAKIILETMIRRSGRHYYVHFFLMDKGNRVEIAQGVGSAIYAHNTLRDDALRYAAQVAISKLCVYQERRVKEGAAQEVRESAPQVQSRRMVSAPLFPPPVSPYGYSGGSGIGLDATAGIEINSPARSRGTVRGFEYGPDGTPKWRIQKIR